MRLKVKGAPDVKIASPLPILNLRWTATMMFIISFAGWIIQVGWDWLRPSRPAGELAAANGPQNAFEDILVKTKINNLTWVVHPQCGQGRGWKGARRRLPIPIAPFSNMRSIINNSIRLLLHQGWPTAAELGTWLHANQQGVNSNAI